MRSPKGQLAFAQRQSLHPTQSWYNLCQSFARQCVGAAAWAPSARLAANMVPNRHRHLSAPTRRGVRGIAYYGSATRGAGHAMFLEGGGWAWSNDLVRRGKIDRVTWRAPLDAWGMPFRFWTDWTPSGMVPQPAPAPTLSEHQLHVLHEAHLYATGKKIPKTDAERAHALHVQHQAHVWVTEGRWIP